MKSVDLFAGCGGLSLGIHEACRKHSIALKAAWACEIDEDAAATFKNNLSPEEISTKPVEEHFEIDLSAGISEGEKALSKEIGDVDFLIGGPPCQGHSDLNNHTRRNDPRNQLYSIMARAAFVLKPKYIVIENVPGVRHSKEGVTALTASKLNELGYSTQDFVLNACDFGVAQSRKRHFTLGSVYTLDHVSMLIDSLKTAERSVTWAIEDLADTESSETFETPAKHSLENNRRIKYLFDNDLYELPDSERPDCHRLKPHSYKSVYGRLYPTRPAPTITRGFGSTGQGRFVHPFSQRTITPHEAARIQFFPDWFRFPVESRRKLQMLIGNAVPPRLGEVIGTALLKSKNI